MGIRLLAGREFTRADVLGAPKVAIVNEAFVRKFNLGRDAVGKRIASDGNTQTARHGDRRPRARTRSTAKCETRCRRCSSAPTGRTTRIGSMAFYVRTSVEPGRLPAERPASGRGARSEPAGREPPDDAAAGAGERVHGSHDQHAVGRLRRAGDAARRGRTLRRARLHRRAADARDRSAHGARRCAGPRPRRWCSARSRS